MLALFRICNKVRRNKNSRYRNSPHPSTTETYVDNMQILFLIEPVTFTCWTLEFVSTRKIQRLTSFTMKTSIRQITSYCIYVIGVRGMGCHVEWKTLSLWSQMPDYVMYSMVTLQNLGQFAWQVHVIYQNLGRNVEPKHFCPSSCNMRL